MAGKVIENSLYIEDLDKIISLYDMSPLYGKTIMISGATGMIGSLIADLLMHLNGISERCNIKIIALGRNRKKAEARFGSYFNASSFMFYECDITKPLTNIDEKVDYIIHAASTTHPLAYSTEPVGTVTSNVLGTMNLLDYGTVHGLKRFVFLSSVEVYGENRGDVDRFDENYCGYINCNTLRAGYPESKRLCEALCQAYRKEKGVEIVIPRLARSFGPTMLMSDTKAISQFIKKGIAGEDIVLKSEGKQLYTYTYAADAVSLDALHTVESLDEVDKRLAGGLAKIAYVHSGEHNLVATLAGNAFSLPHKRGNAGVAAEAAGKRYGAVGAEIVAPVLHF